MNVYLDMDGVLVNLTKKMTAFGHYSGGMVIRPEVFGLLFSDDWATMEPYPWVADLLGMCQDIDPKASILTTLPRYGTNQAFLGKTQWVRKHLGPMPVCYCEEIAKSRCGSGLLIDDFEENCYDWELMGCGRAILFPQPYNSAREHVGREMAYMRERLV